MVGRIGEATALVGAIRVGGAARGVLTPVPLGLGSTQYRWDLALNACDYSAASHAVLPKPSA